MLQRKANADQFYFSRREIEDEFENYLKEQTIVNNVKIVFIAGASSL